jgi:hypothetical protein
VLFFGLIFALEGSTQDVLLLVFKDVMKSTKGKIKKREATLEGSTFIPRLLR